MRCYGLCITKFFMWHCCSPLLFNCFAPHGVDIDADGHAGDGAVGAGACAPANADAIVSYQCWWFLKQKNYAEDAEMAPFCREIIASAGKLLQKLVATLPRQPPATILWSIY